MTKTTRVAEMLMVLIPFSHSCFVVVYLSTEILWLTLQHLLMLSLLFCLLLFSCFPCSLMLSDTFPHPGKTLCVIHYPICPLSHCRRMNAAQHISVFIHSTKANYHLLMSSSIQYFSMYVSKCSELTSYVLCVTYYTSLGFGYIFRKSLWQKYSLWLFLLRLSSAFSNISQIGINKVISYLIFEWQRLCRW